MLTVLGLVLRLALHKLAVGVAFALKHWRITLPVVACAILALLVKHHLNVVKELEQAKYEYSAHLKQDDLDKEIRRKANKEKEDKFAQELIKSKNDHAAIILNLKGSYNEKLKHKDAAIANANTLRDSLRRKLEEANAAARLSEGTNRLIRLAEVGQYSNAAGAGQTDTDYINTLEYACAITTADYNTLYDRCEAVNRVFGEQQP